RRQAGDQPCRERALRRAGVRRTCHRLRTDPLRQMADLPGRHGGIRPSRALQGTGHADGHCRGTHDAGLWKEAAVDLRVPAQDLGGVRRHQAPGRSGRDPAGRGALARAVRRGFLGRAGEDAGRQGPPAGSGERVLAVSSEVLRRLEIEEQRDLPQVEDQTAHQRRDARGLRQAGDRSRGQVRSHPAQGRASGVIASCSRALQSLHVEVNGAPWFAALGEPLTDNVRALAADYGGTDGVTYVRSWREAEDFLKSSATSLEWWDHEEDLRKRLLAEAEAKYPGQSLWTALTDLTTEAGDLVHGKAAAAAASLGGAQPAS